MGDVYLRHDFGNTGTLTLGQFKQHFSLDDRTSPDYGQFLERGGGANTLAPEYHKGVSWKATHQNTTWWVSAYSLDSISLSNVNGRGLGGRGTWSPDTPEGDVLHLGLSLAHQRYDHPGSDGMGRLKHPPTPGWAPVRQQWHYAGAFRQRTRYQSKQMGTGIRASARTAVMAK